ncbi:MAG: hypothetical protein K0R14_667 [Burkholderiales bacterium]|jgi:hypothetical protein|nr:hypothetical protein [Burkholderiales bacterium]
MPILNKTYLLLLLITGFLTSPQAKELTILDCAPTKSYDQGVYIKAVKLKAIINEDNKKIDINLEEYYNYSDDIPISFPVKTLISSGDNRSVLSFLNSAKGETNRNSSKVYIGNWELKKVGNNLFSLSTSLDKYSGYDPVSLSCREEAILHYRGGNTLENISRGFYNSVSMSHDYTWTVNTTY